MKVLMVCDSEIDRDNPVRNFDFDQSLALKKAGIDVRIIALDCRTILHSKKIVTINKNILGIQVVCASVLVRLIPHGLKEFICRKKINALYKRFFANWAPDIIHAQWGPNSFLVSDVVKKYNIPLVVTEHCSKMNRLNPEKTYLKYSKKGYEIAKRRICVGSSLQKNLFINTGYHFEIIENVLDPLLFDNNFALQKHTASKRIRLISAGHLIKSKNFTQLINAMFLIKNIDYQLDIYGSGPEKQNLKKQIAKFNLNDRIFVHDEIPRYELITKYQSSDAFILLSISETFGVVFIEAMACGLPVFSLKCGGTDDIINDNGIGGVLLNSNDTETISRRIELFLQQLDTFDRKAISQTSLKRYGHDAFSKKLISLYSEVIYEKA